MNEHPTVKIKRADVLSGAEKKSLLRLVARCREAEPFTMTLPSGADDAVFLLLYSGRRLAAALVLCPSGDGTSEALAFTHPSYRRRGFFRQLVREARGTAGARLVFTADQFCGNAPAAAEALGLKPCAEDLLMERTLRGSGIPGDRQDAFRIHAFPSADPEDTSVLYEARSGGTLLLSLLVLPRADRAAYVFGVEVPEELRGAGTGSRVLPAMLRRLKRDGFLRVLVHVSGDNVPAVRLYRRCGFTESLRLISYA